MNRKKTNAVLLYILSGILFLSFLGNFETIFEWQDDKKLHKEDVGSLMVSNILIAAVSVVCFIAARRKMKKSKQDNHQG